MIHATAMPRRVSDTAAHPTDPSRDRPAIFRIALAILASVDQAEDATQEVLFRLSRDPEKLAQAENPRAWVRTVTVRVCLNHVTRRPKWLRLTHDVPAVGFDDSAIAVAQTLRKLRPEHRVILALAHQEGLSHREMAELLEIPEGTVASRLHAARAAFRSAWEDPR